MPKACDHTSVGMIVWKDGRILLIERAKFPFGFSVPAGHVDDDPSFETAAARELKEEVGLAATELTLAAEGRKDNQCRRNGGTWHYWKMYTVEVAGEVDGSKDETKQVGWYSVEEIRELGKRTERYVNGEVSEEAWQQNPGLVPVMYEWLRDCTII